MENENFTNSVDQDITTDSNIENNIVDTPTTENNSFEIPEEYKSKGWAKNIKSQADLFKAYDNATSLIGKKTIGIPDFDNASEEEINDFYSKLVPADTKDYDFGDIEIDENTKNSFADIFKNNGINKKAGKNILNAYQQMVEKAMGTEEELNNELKERFGNSFNEEKEKELSTMFNKYMSTQDRQMMAKMPVKIQALMCSFADNVKKSYGIDLKSSVESNSLNVGYTKADYDKEILELYKLDSQHQLSPAMKQARLERIDNIRKSINWSK